MRYVRWPQHRPETRLDPDMASYCIVKAINDGPDGATSGRHREPKQAFHPPGPALPTGATLNPARAVPPDRPMECAGGVRGWGVRTAARRLGRVCVVCTDKGWGGW
ncbi:hypothetical protein GCM10010388_69290 [Streptomyces mauvecolor]